MTSVMAQMPREWAVKVAAVPNEANGCSSANVLAGLLTCNGWGKAKFMNNIFHKIKKFTSICTKNSIPVESGNCYRIINKLKLSTVREYSPMAAVPALMKVNSAWACLIQLGLAWSSLGLLAVENYHSWKERILISLNLSNVYDYKGYIT